MSEKKLSFGFTNRLLKKPIIIPARQPQAPKPVQLIDCLEGQTIKIKDAVVVEHKPLVIPIQASDKNLVERVIEAKKLKERSKGHDESLKEDNRPDSELSLDELAARQLISEAKNSLEAASSKNGAAKVHVLPAVEDTLILEGSKEPTLHDYENVPIGDYGMAMLRGMGWSDKEGIGKDKKSVNVTAPELRPKGMGLGAYKMVQEEQPKMAAIGKDGKELSLVKDACAKIIAGKEKGFYCKVQGLDDEAGRVIVKMAIKGTILSLNEFMLCPVTSEEYAASSRVLNNSKFQEYQEMDAKSSQVKSDKSTSSTANEMSKVKAEEYNKKESQRRRSRTPDVKTERKYEEAKSKKRSRSRSYERSSKRERHRDRSRSRSHDNRKSAKYRSRSRSVEKSKYRAQTSRRYSKSPPKSTNTQSKSRRSKSRSRSIEKLPVKKIDKKSRSSSTEKSSKQKESSGKLKKSKKRCSSDSSESESEDRKRRSEKKTKKKHKKKKSKKHDSNSSDEKSKSRKDKKKVKNSDSSDDDRHKQKSSTRK